MALFLLTGFGGGVSAQVAFEDVSIPAGFAGSGSETWGAAWGRLDGDIYPDLFVNNHRTRAVMYRNNGNGTFTDVSQQADASDMPGWTGGRSDVDKHGSTWVDIDNDGDDDLYMSISSSRDYLLINDNGVLTDRSQSYRLTSMGHSASRQSLFMDINGDGRLDMAAIALNKSAFYPQLANATFGTGTGVQTPITCTSDAQWAHLADVHPAGGLELLCAPRKSAYPKSINAFSGNSILDVTAGFPTFSTINDATSLDFNGDLKADIFMVRGGERPSDAYQESPNRFEAQFITARNKAKWVTFKSTGVLTLKVSLREGSDPQGNPDYIDIGDLRWSPTSLQFQLNPASAINHGIRTGSRGINIGYLPATGEWQIRQGNAEYSYAYVEVTSTQPITNLTFFGASGPDTGMTPVLISDTGSGYAKVNNAGFNYPIRCQSVASGDFDNDTDEDLFLGCTGGSHNIANRLFLNDGNGKFTEVANAGGAAGLTGSSVGQQAGSTESVVVADYDIDGFLDVFVTNGSNMRPIEIGGPKQLFRNLGNLNKWVQFDLVGTTSNRSAVGSKVFLTAGGKTQYREQNGGYHRWSQNSQRVHFGLGANVVADVTVKWPDGSETSYTNLPANGLYQLKQDGTHVALVGALDSDGDGIDDAQEAQIGTDPNNPDTDADGLGDGAELAAQTNPLVADTDGDTLRDGDEVNVYGTDPRAKNTDADGLNDNIEIFFKGTDPLNPDTDGDGLTDGQEAGQSGYGTNPLNPDSDGGGVNDGIEVGRGTDPLNSSDD